MANRGIQAKVERARRNALHMVPRFAIDNFQPERVPLAKMPAKKSVDGGMVGPRCSEKELNRKLLASLDGKMVRRVPSGKASGLFKDVGNMGERSATRALTTHGDGTRITGGWWKFA